MPFASLLFALCAFFFFSLCLSSHLFQVIDKGQLLPWGEPSLKAPLGYLRPWLHLLSSNSLADSGMCRETKAQIIFMGEAYPKAPACVCLALMIQVGVSNFMPF